VLNVHWGLGSTGRTWQTLLDKFDCAGIPSHRAGARAKVRGARLVLRGQGKILRAMPRADRVVNVPFAPVPVLRG